MKLLLPLILLVGALALTAAPVRVGTAPARAHDITLCGEKKPRRNIGPCMPYAEVCLNCSDCSACGHCQGKGGICSKCKDKPER